MNALDIIGKVCRKTGVSPTDFDYIPDPKDMNQMCDLYYMGHLCPEKYDPINGLDLFIDKISQWVLELQGV